MLECVSNEDTQVVRTPKVNQYSNKDKIHIKGYKNLGGEISEYLCEVSLTTPKKFLSQQKFPKF